MSTPLKRGDTFHIGQICPESGIYRLKDRDCKGRESCHSEDQREIPLTKGATFPPCRTCKGPVIWEFVRKA
jgi:hypothetical protein